MLKIIKTNKEIDQETILKYAPPTNDVVYMMQDDNKYNVDLIEHYVQNFMFIKDEEYRVGIIKEADKLSEKHQNKLLKFFENSDDNTIHLMFVSNEEHLLDTIKSRGNIYYDGKFDGEFNDSNIHKFAKTIITNSSQYNLLLEDESIFVSLYNINEVLLLNKIDEVIIQSSLIKLDQDTYKLLLNMLLNYYRQKNNYNAIEEILRVDEKPTTLNLNLQIDALLIKLKNL
ncbi:MAG: hypothetical protein ACK5HS_00325 [Mycoplasmatales bacterium]